MSAQQKVSSSKKEQHHCVVMGTENVHPEKFADILRESFTSFSERKQQQQQQELNIIAPAFHVETACVPKPYTVQLSATRSAGAAAGAGFFAPAAPTLRAAFILFNPMRPLSFVRVDAFLDRLMHVPSLKIVIVVLDVDATASESAVASLRDSSRCRPVSAQDVQKYVLLKRRWLRAKDDQELAQEARWAGSGEIQIKAPRCLSVFVIPARRNQLLENAVQDFFSSAADGLLEFQMQQQSNLLLSSSSATLFSTSGSPLLFSSPSSSSFRLGGPAPSRHRYLFRLFEWCFVHDFDKERDATTTKHPAAAAAVAIPLFTADASESSDGKTKQQDNNDQSSSSNNNHSILQNMRLWNDEFWSKDWHHEVDTAAEFFQHQRKLFGHHHVWQGDTSAPLHFPTVVAATKEAEEWVVLMFKGAPRESLYHAITNAAAAVEDDGTAADEEQQQQQQFAASRHHHDHHHHHHLTSSAVFSSSHSLRRRVSAHQNLPASPVRDSSAQRLRAASAAMAGMVGSIEQQQHLADRYAFWNPRTGDISLSVPKALVLDRQVSQHVVSEVLAKKEKQKKTEGDKDNHQSPGRDDDEESRLQCVPHLVRKATLAAAEQQRENRHAADRAAAERIQALQQQQVAVERRHRELQAAKAGMLQQLEELKSQRADIKQRAFQVQRRHAAAKMQLSRDAVSGEFAVSPQQRQQLEVARDKAEALESAAALSDWKARQSRRNMLELEQYAASGGRAELTRLYFVKFLSNQQLRRDLARVEERNAEIQCEIDSVHAQEFRPVNVRRLLLERRKEEIVSETHSMLQRDMADTPSLGLFLAKMAKKNRRRKRRYPFSETAGLNVSDDEDDDERFLDDNSDEELERMFGRSKRGSKKSRRVNDDDSSASSSASSNYLSEVSATSRDSSSNSSSSDSDAGSDGKQQQGQRGRRSSTKRPPRRLFENSIRKLRRSIRDAQQILRYNVECSGVISLRAVKNCKSTAFHEIVIAGKDVSSSSSSSSSELLVSWIDEFAREIPSAVLSSSSSAVASTAISGGVPGLLAEYSATVARRRWTVTQVQERIERHRIELEQAALAAQLWAAAVTHSRNLAVRAIKQAKAKRKALFGEHHLRVSN